MSLRLRRGPSTDRISLVFQAGELVYDTTEKRLYIGDDLTQGGVPVSDLLSDLSPQLGANLDLNGEDIIGFGNINIDGDITATGTLTIPRIVTDVTGSIFGDDSTPLVDGANSKLVLDNNALSDLGDVIAPDQDKQFLEWDNSTNTWRPKTFNLTDYVFNSTENSYLRFNGSSWVASNIIDNISSKNGRILVNAETEILYLEGNSLADIGDVFLSGTPAHGSILKYNSTTEYWEADSSGIAVNLNDLSDVNSGVVPLLGDILTWNGLEWAFEQPKQTTNVVGSVFGDNSTILVDGIANKINLSNNSIGDLDDVEPYIESTIEIGSILKWNGFRWQIADPAQLDTFTGSVYGDDSTLIIDGQTGTINTDIISYSQTLTLNDSAPIGGFSFLKQSVTDAVLTYEMNKIVSTGLSTINTTNEFLGQITFRTSDNVEDRLRGAIYSFEGLLAFAAGEPLDAADDYNASQYIVLQDNKFCIGGASPAEKLDVRGNAKVEGFVQFGSYADATARDAAITSPAKGMVIFLDDDGSLGGSPAVPKFQGFDGTSWVNLN